MSCKHTESFNEYMIEVIIEARLSGLLEYCKRCCEVYEGCNQITQEIIDEYTTIQDHIDYEELCNVQDNT